MHASKNNKLAGLVKRAFPVILAAMKIISWNVNGIRAAERKGFLDWLQQESADIVCVQETKAHPDQLSGDLHSPPGYQTFWNWAEKKGYSGVAIFSKDKPKAVTKGFNHTTFDAEGRVLSADYEDFVLLNIYFPNGQRGPDRLQFKMDFYAETMRYVRGLKKKGREVIISGDYNTAHKEIDLARPKENQNTSGFLPVERAWIDDWVKDGQIDVYREFEKSGGHYTYWDQKSRARDRNVGWRIDYHFVTENLAKKVTAASIMPEVMGSDHCPLSIELKE